MRNFISFYVLIVLCFTIISCKDETEISDFEVSEVTFDTKLRDVLTRKGFNFSENGELICDNQVLNTTSLDLSRCELTSISGLRSFPSLADVNLECNSFSIFDFADLPEGIKSVALRGNDGITSYLNLISTDGTTVLCKSLTNLKLPYFAKWNTDVIPAFYKAMTDKCLVVMSDEDGNYTEYTVNRRVPDPLLRSYLYRNFPSVFVSSLEIDVTKRITEGNDLIFLSQTANLEGVEYILSNPGFRGKVDISGVKSKHYSMSYVKPSSGVSVFSISNIDTPLGMDLSSASSLKVLRVENNSSLQLVVVPSVILNDDVSETSIFDSEIHISGCSSLERVSLQGSKGGNMIGKLHFADLPALDYLDVSAVEAVNTVVLTDVNLGIGSILLPSELTAFLDGTGRFSPTSQIALCINHPKVSSFMEYCKNVADIIDVSFFYK